MAYNYLLCPSKYSAFLWFQLGSCTVFRHYNNATMATPAPTIPPAMTGAAVAAAPSELSVFAASVTVLTTSPAAFVAWNNVSDFRTDHGLDILPQ